MTARRGWLIGGAVLMLAIGAAVLAYVLTMAGGNPLSPTAGPTTPVAVLDSGVAARPRVATLMQRAGCQGTVVGTQFYSYETGRCTLGAAEVIIAVFDTADLRDRWVATAREFGGTIVLGNGWAATVTGPDEAATVAERLNGIIRR